MPLSLLESLRERRSPWLLGAAVAVAAIAVVGAIAWYTLRASPPLFAGETGSGGATPGITGENAEASGGDAAADPPAQPPSIYVHIAGAVKVPGVYELAQGKRVIDAIAAAGGGTPDSAVNSINLAEPLSDGQRLYVPTKREAQGTRPGGTYTGGKAFTPPVSSGGSSGSSDPAVCDINTATKEELDRIPGIGPVIAERIVLYRTANGPFKTVDDLTKVSGIGDKKLQDLRPYVTIR